MKNLIKFNFEYDYGSDFYVQFFNIKKWSLLQVSLSWNNYHAWPYAQIKSGSGSLLSVIFWIYKFGFDIDVFSRTWDFDYMKDIDTFDFMKDVNIIDNKCNYDD